MNEVFSITRVQYGIPFPRFERIKVFPLRLRVLKDWYYSRLRRDPQFPVRRLLQTFALRNFPILCFRPLTHVSKDLQDKIKKRKQKEKPKGKPLQNDCTVVQVTRTVTDTDQVTGRIVSVNSKHNVTKNRDHKGN